MKRVLILDDDWGRHHLFLRAFKEDIVCSVSRFSDFVRELHNGSCWLPFGEVSLES
jgi:hypothetical protein